MLLNWNEMWMIIKCGACKLLNNEMKYCIMSFSSCSWHGKDLGESELACCHSSQLLRPLLSSQSPSVAPDEMPSRRPYAPIPVLCVSHSRTRSWHHRDLSSRCCSHPPRAAESFPIQWEGCDHRRSRWPQRGSWVWRGKWSCLPWWPMILELAHPEEPGGQLRGDWLVFSVIIKWPGLSKDAQWTVRAVLHHEGNRSRLRVPHFLSRNPVMWVLGDWALKWVYCSISNSISLCKFSFSRYS